MIDEELDIPFGPLDQVCGEIRTRPPPSWKGLFESQTISADEMSVLEDLSVANREARWNELFHKEQPSAHLLPLFVVLERLQAAERVYILVLLYDVLLAFPKVCKVALVGVDLQGISRLLAAKDEIVEIQAARVLVVVGRLLGDLDVDGTTTAALFTWIEEGLRAVESRATIASLILQHALRVEGIKAKFNKSPTLFISLVEAYRRTKNVQIQYQCLFCIWLLSFSAKLINEYHIFDFIPAQMEIVKSNGKEKLMRICMATWKNLISNKASKAHAIPVMIGAKLLDYLETLLSRGGLKDEEVLADANLIRDDLNKAYHSLNSFDEYASEIKSGMLEWSPPHRSSLFWQENAARLEEENCDLLRLLTRILATSQDPLVLSVAANDIGQYIQVRPHGKANLQRLGTKEQLMLLMSHGDADVRFNALTAVQTYMSKLWKSV